MGHFVKNSKRAILDSSAAVTGPGAAVQRVSGPGQEGKFYPSHHRKI